MQNSANVRNQNLTSEEQIKNSIKSIKPYLAKLWLNRKKLLWFNLIIAALMLLILFFIVKPYYESLIAILPEYGSKSNNLGDLNDLAVLAGVKVGEGAPTEIYENLIKSESVLAPVIYSKFKTEEFKDSVNLIEYFDIDVNENDHALQSRKKFIEAYRELTESRIVTNIDRNTKILTVQVTMPESKLSAAVANAIAKSLDNYIRTKRKSYASEQRFYIEKRLGQVKDSLSIAENKLKNFREENRIVSQSPALLLQQGRLMRNVEIQQNVYIELTKRLELAKIDEIKETPIVNIKELAQDPVIKAGPKRAVIFIVVMFFSILLSGAYFMFRDDFKKYYSLLRS